MHDWQKILIAVNDSDDALRAVQYVGNVVRDVESASVYLLSVYPDPPPDYYDKGGTLEAYSEIMHDQAGSAIKLAISQLNQSGLPNSAITSHIQLADGKTISQIILDAITEHGCNTLVVGKRGISKNEEFLFGSISNTLARKTKGFTTWIVG